MNINFTICSASLKQIFCFIRDNDAAFTPSFSSSVNIAEYSAKIYEKALLFEAWERGLLIGLLAVYKNIKTGKYYISYFCVEKKGVGHLLFDYFRSECREYDDVELEVRKTNFYAISFYKKLGFFQVSESEDKLYFRLNNMNNEIVVSIACVTYNHRPYIKECLDGFLMQKTNFRYEILIHDDASTDGTADIIREYEAKYPDIIKPIYQKENQYSKGVSPSAKYNFPRAKGKYIAMCEGDDYWTDPLKLQKQVDFLESHPDYVMCSHRFHVYEQSKKTLMDDWLTLSREENFYFDIDYFISRREWVTQPLTILFRLSALNMEYYLLYSKPKDVVLMYSLLLKGKGVMLRDFMGVYRIHSGGVWQGVNRLQQIKSELEMSIEVYDVNKTETSALFVKNTINMFGYLGMSFFKDNFKIYQKSLMIIYKEFGIKEFFKLFWRTTNYFHRYFGC